MNDRGALKKLFGHLLLNSGYLRKKAFKRFQRNFLHSQDLSFNASVESFLDCLDFAHDGSRDRRSIIGLKRLLVVVYSPAVRSSE